jgi:hypothetical protein
MKQHVLLLLFVAAIAAAGCGKSSDLAPTAAEATGIAKSYQPRVAELEQRAQELVRRGNAIQLGADATPASDQLAGVIKDLIPRMQKVVQEAPTRIEQTLEDDKLDEAKKLEELRTYSHQIATELDTNWTRANAQLDAVDAWLSRAERRAATPTPTPPTTTAPATNTPAPQPEPTPTPTPPAAPTEGKAPEGAGTAGGSAAPGR